MAYKPTLAVGVDQHDIDISRPLMSVLSVVSTKKRL